MVPNGKKKTTKRGLFGGKQTTFHLQHTFMYIFFPVVLHDQNLKLPETRVMEEMLYVFLFTIFFTVTHFHLSGRLHFQLFLIFSPPLVSVAICFTFQLFLSFPSYQHLLTSNSSAYVQKQSMILFHSIQQGLVEDYEFGQRVTGKERLTRG